MPKFRGAYQHINHSLSRLARLSCFLHYLKGPAELHYLQDGFVDTYNLLRNGKPAYHCVSQVTTTVSNTHVRTGTASYGTFSAISPLHRLAYWGKQHIR